MALLAIERASNIHHSRLKDPTRHFAGVGQRAAVGQAEQKGGVGVSAAEHKGTVLRGINDDAGEVKLKYHQTSESVIDIYRSQGRGFICAAISFHKPNWKVCHILFDPGR